MADNGLHFEITANNSELEQVVKNSEELIGGLEEKAKEVSTRLNYFFKDGLHIDSETIEETFKDFSMDEYVKEMEKFIAAGGDARAQYEELWLFINKVRADAVVPGQNQMDWKRVSEETKAIYDNVVKAVSRLGQEVVKIPFEVVPATGVGKDVILPKEEIARLEQERNQIAGEWDGVTETVADRSRYMGRRTIKELTNLIEEAQKHLQGLSIAGALDEESFRGIFDLHKNISASTLSVEELKNSLSELQAYTSNGESIAESYVKQREELQKLLPLLEERAQALKSSSESERDPEKKAALAEQAEKAEQEIEQTRNRIGELSAQHARLLSILEEGQAVSERYSEVLRAATDAETTDSVAELSRKLQEEEQQMRETAVEMENLTQKMSEYQAKLEKDNLSEKNEKETIDNIENLQAEIDKLSTYYQTLTERAARYRYERDKAMEGATREQPTSGGGGGGGTPPTPPDDWKERLKGNNKEIKDLVKELERLKDKSEELSQEQSKVTGLFDSYRNANAATMSIRELNRANDEIADGFKNLTDTQNAYKSEMENLETTINKQKENLALLAQAQKEALANGDNRTAAKLLQQYAETEQQIKSNENALSELQGKYANLQTVVDNNADVQERYKAALDAKELVAAGMSVAELTKLYDKEAEEMKVAAVEVGNLQDKISELQAKIDSGKMSPQGIDLAKSEIEQYRKKISELSEQYQIASDRARIFGKEIGKDAPQTSPVFNKNDRNSGSDDGGASATIGKVGSSAKETATQLGRLRMNVTSITSGFSAMAQGGSGVIKGLAGIGKGVMGLSAQLATLLANPFVAIIAAIAAALMVLYKIVTSFINGTSAGADMFASWIGYIKGFRAAIEQFTMEVSRKVAEFVKNFGSIMSGVGTVVGNVVLAIGQTITAGFEYIGAKLKNGWTRTKAFFKGEEVNEDDLVKNPDFSAIWNDVRKAAKEMGKIWDDSFSDFEMPSFKDFMNTYARIEELQRGIIKKQREWTVASAQLESQQAELQDQLSRAGNVDKLQKMLQLQDLITKKYDSELSIARDELKVQQEMNRLKGRNVSDEDLKKEAELQAKVLGIEQKRTNEKRSLTNQHTDLTRQLEEERRGQARILANNARDKQIAALQQQLKYEKDVTKQLEIQDEIRRKQLEKELGGINKQQQDAITKNLNATAGQAYANGASKDELKAMFIDNEKAQLEIDRLFDYYDKLRSDAMAKSEQEGTFANYDKDFQAYMKYCEDVIAAENWKQEELRKIAAGDSTMTEDQVNRVYDNQVQQAAKNANIDAAELKLTDIAAKFQAQIANATVDGIEEAMKELETAMKGENDLIDSILGMTAEQKAARTDELKEQIAPDEEIVANSQAVLDDENATPEQRAEAEQAIADAEERMLNAKRELLLLSYDQQQLEGQRIKNQEVLDRMIKQGNEAQKKGNKVVSETTIRNMRDMEALSSSLGAVADMADAVADTFGGAMSKKARKALGVISDVAKTGTSVISGIENLVNTATKGMEATAAAGVSSMSALEKASFILTILSVAVQAITAIVNIVSKFTDAAQMQDAIDKQKEKVKQLEYEHEKIERQYQNSSGTAYYKGLAESAKDYDNIIREQTEALRKSQELYEYQKNKHGEDSGKAEDAKEQMQEMEKQKAEYEQAQREQYQQLLEDLSGTDLQSFSQSLADALVDGFAQGKDGIEDVWEDTMDDLMRTMMKQQLALAITDMFDPVFKHLNEYTKNGELNQSEIDMIMSEFDAKSAQAKALAEQYYNLMNERGLLDDADTEGSQGFGQMTQDQADTLTARFTALQMEGANVVATAQLMLEQMLEIGADGKLQVASLQTLVLNSGMCMQIAQEQLDQLQIIADNTELLNETNTRLRAIEQNTDKL